MSAPCHITLFNRSCHPLTRSSCTGNFSVQPPEVVQAASTVEFELSSDDGVTSTCTYSSDDGSFTFEWKSNSANEFKFAIPETYTVESSTTDGKVTVVLKEAAKEVGSVPDQTTATTSTEAQPEESADIKPTTPESPSDSESSESSGSSSGSPTESPAERTSSIETSDSMTPPTMRKASLGSTSMASMASFAEFAETMKGDRVLERRDYIMMEILKSERTYVENLTTLLTTYLNALKAIPDSTLPSSLVQKIFSNAGEILPVNKQLLAELEKKWNNWGPTQTIGEVIYQMTPFLKTYKNYTARYSEALNALRECEKNPKFQSVTYKCTVQCRFDLDALLIQPVQRIPRYNLLLADLLKNTDEGHPDFKNLTKSIEEMKNIAQYINESIQMNENRKKVIDIHNNMTSLPPDLNLVEPHRVFVMQGVLTKVCRKTPKKFTFFLFSDILIYADLVLGDKYRCHHVLYLSKSRFIDKGIPLTFDIVSEKKSFAVLTKDSEEKDEWMAKLDAQTRQLKTRRASLQANTGEQLLFEMSNSEAPVWVPDDAAKTCYKCSDTFTIISRRHHCRVCGLLVCGKCSPKKMRIPSMDNKNVRVCTQCYGKQKLQQILETQEA